MRDALMTGRQAVDGRHTGTDDAVLLEQVADGDRDALGALYRRHAHVVLAQIRLVVGERGLSEEILQDTMLAVWQGAGSFRGISQVRSWIIAIALRQARDRLRRRRLAVVADDSALSGQAAREPGPEAQVLERAELAAVADAIRSLSPGHREVLGLVAGTLASVSGSTLQIKPLIGPVVRVTTSDSTRVGREVTGTLADVRDGLHVIVSGTLSHGRIAARRIGLTPSSLGMQAPLLPAQGPPAAVVLGIANGTVADAGTGGFTVAEPGGTHVRVTTSASTKVVMLASVGVAQLRTGQRTVAVGSVTGQRELAARTVEQENLPLSRLRSPLGYQPAPRPAGYPRLPPAGWPRSLPGGFPRPARSWFPGPASLPGFVPGPGALFSGLGCNAPAIAATGLLAYGS